MVSEAKIGKKIPLQTKNVRGAKTKKVKCLPNKETNGKTTIKKQISNNFWGNGGLLQKKATKDRTEVVLRQEVYFRKRERVKVFVLLLTYNLSCKIIDK